MAMIKFDEIKQDKVSLYNNIEKLSFIQSSIIKTITALSNSNSALKLSFYEKFLSFLRTVCIYIINNNEIKVDEVSINDLKDNRIKKSIFDLLINLGIVEFINNIFVINEKYNNLFDNKIINDVIDSNRLSNTDNLNKYEIAIITDFLFVIDLVTNYRDTNHKFSFIKKNTSSWKNLINKRLLDYEVRLCETLLNLKDLKLDKNIKSPFTDDYYTESGRNAFNNYTKDRFVEFVKEIKDNNENQNVLDIGCGYGNYIDILKENFSNYSITGVELNPVVFNETKNKFESDENVTIINDDIFKLKSSNKFDIALLNYVIFYFNKSEKEDLLKKIKSLLSENGSIIICQYFSEIEKMKKELAIKQDEYNFSKSIEMYYGNKILYANTLWNDSVDAFSESAKWNELEEICDKLDLKINHITNADGFYFSLFLELNHK